MENWPKPRVVVSRCLEFAPCRYNGQVIKDSFIKRLEPYVEYIPVCPEVEAGMTVPRESVRLVKGGTGEGPRLIRPSDGMDFSGAMATYTEAFLGSIGEVDGFILKSRSPSCGIQDVKIYAHSDHPFVSETGGGLFASAVLPQFPHASVEEEGRLRNLQLREHFLAKLFVRAAFRGIRTEPSVRELQSFHAAHKYLFMCYSPQQLKRMGDIAANRQGLAPRMAFDLYEQEMEALFRALPAEGGIHNVCLHLFGYFSKLLNRKEKEHFLHMLEGYRNNMMPLPGIKSMLYSWSIRFERDYLLRQSFFQPYPEGLCDLSDSGKGREVHAQ